MSSLGSRLRAARESKGLYQSQLAQRIGVKSAAVISNWEKDINKPDAEKIVRLCKVLNISVSYLLDYYGRSSFDLSPQEQAHIQSFRCLDKHGKEAVENCMKIEMKRIRDGEQNPIRQLFPIALPMAEQPVGANAEISLRIDSIRTIFVKDNALTRQAAFAAAVAGDSMQPLYSDGDILLIAPTNKLSAGKVGVFVMDGRSYIRKLENGRPVSLDGSDVPVASDGKAAISGAVVGVLEQDWILPPHSSQEA